jgi:hypothetical protein
MYVFCGRLLLTQALQNCSTAGTEGMRAVLQY